MIDLLIGIAILAAIGLGLRQFFRFAAKQQEDRVVLETQALYDFCEARNFIRLEGVEKDTKWAKIEPLIGLGALGLFFSSESGMDAHLGMRKGESDNEYVVLRKSGKAQSGGTRRYLAGVFIEREEPGSGELFIAPASFLTKFMQKKDGWQHLETKKPYRAYVRGAGFPEHKKDVVMNKLIQLGKPYLSLYMGQTGIFMYHEFVGKWPKSENDYERIYRAANAMVQAF